MALHARSLHEGFVTGGWYRRHHPRRLKKRDMLPALTQTVRPSTLATPIRRTSFGTSRNWLEALRRSMRRRIGRGFNCKRRSPYVPESPRPAWPRVRYQAGRAAFSLPRPCWDYPASVEPSPSHPKPLQLARDSTLARVSENGNLLTLSVYYSAVRIAHKSGKRGL